MPLADSFGGGLLPDLRPETPDSIPDRPLLPAIHPDGTTQDDRERVRLATQNIRQASGLQPDQAAKDMAISKRFGVSPNLAELGRDELLRRQEEDDFHQLVAGAPLTQSFLTKDRFNYAISKDDLPSLTAVEQKLLQAASLSLSRSSQGDPDPVNTATGLDWIAKAGKRAWDVGSAQNDIAFARQAASLGKASDGLMGDKSMDALADRLNRNAPAAPEAHGWWEEAWTEAAKMAPQQIEQAKGAINYGTQGMALGAMIGGWIGAGTGVLGGPAAPGTVPGGWAAGAAAGAAVGHRVGVTYGAFDTSRRLEAGSARNELMDIRDEKGRPLDSTVLDIASEMVGIVNGGIELFQLERAAKWVPGVGEVFARKAVTNAFKEALRSPTIRGALTKVGMHLFKDVAAETMQEGVQEIAQIAGQEASKIFSNGEFKSITAEEFVSRVVDTMDASYKAFALMQAPFGSVHAARAVRQEMRIADNSRKAQALMQDLADIGSGSATAKRSTGAWGSFYEHLASQIDGAPDKVFVSTEAILKAADTMAGIEHAEASGAEAPARPGTDPKSQMALDEILSTLGTTKEQFQKDSETSGTVSVPFTLFQGQVAHTPLGQSLLSDAKLDPLHMSLNEQADHDKHYQETRTYYQGLYEESKATHEADMQKTMEPFYQALEKVGIRGSVAEAQLAPILKRAEVVARHYSAIEGRVVSPAEVIRDKWNNLGLKVVDAPKAVDVASFVKDAGLNAELSDKVAGAAHDPMTGKLVVNPTARATQDQLTKAAETVGQQGLADLSGVNVKVIIPHEGKVIDLDAKTAISQTSEMAQRLENILNCLG